MIIGFGKTETDFENALESDLIDMVSAMYEPAPYFDEEFAEGVRKAADFMSQKSIELSDIYKTAEKYPERYSRYWISTVSDASHIVFIVSFSHINRRHALSPDGWAAMSSKRAFFVEHQDMRKKARAA